MEKQKNIIIEYIDPDIEYSDDEIEENEEEIDDIEIINNIRLEMIKYCDDMCIPLCDYLTYDNLLDFIDNV